MEEQTPALGNVVKSSSAPMASTISVIAAQVGRTRIVVAVLTVCKNVELLEMVCMVCFGTLPKSRQRIIHRQLSFKSSFVRFNVFYGWCSPFSHGQRIRNRRMDGQKIYTVKKTMSKISLGKYLLDLRRVDVMRYFLKS